VAAEAGKEQRAAAEQRRDTQAAGLVSAAEGE